MSFLEGSIPPRVMHNNRRREKRKTKWHTLKVSLFIYVRSLQRNNRRELQSCRLRESSRDTSRTLFPVFPRPAFPNILRYRTSTLAWNYALHLCTGVQHVWKSSYLWERKSVFSHNFVFWIVSVFSPPRFGGFFGSEGKTSFFLLSSGNKNYSLRITCTREVVI